MIKQLFGGRGPHFGVGDIETRKRGSIDIFKTSKEGSSTTTSNFVEIGGTAWKCTKNKHIYRHSL